MGQLLIGCSGWNYRDWVIKREGKGGIYPSSSRATDYLSFYSQVFGTVEVEQTAFGVVQPQIVSQWKQETPENFKFSLVMWRKITNDKLLRVRSDLVDKWFKPLQLLQDKIGVILLIFPSMIRVDQLDRLERFLTQLPSGYRYAIEFKHSSWLTGAPLTLLQRKNIAWVSSYTPNEIQFLRFTGDFTYLRFRGEPKTFSRFDRLQTDPLPAFQRMAEQIRAATQRGDVFVFINNNFAGNAPQACAILQQILVPGKPISVLTLEGLTPF